MSGKGHNSGAPGFVIEVSPSCPEASAGMIARHVLPVLDTASPGAVVYVTPTRRKAEAVERELMRLTGRALIGEPVLTLNRFMSLLFDRSGAQGAAISDVERLAIIADVLRAAPDAASLSLHPDRFPGVVRKFAGIFASVEQNNIFDAATLRERLEKRAKGKVATDKATTLCGLFESYRARLSPENNSLGVALYDAEDKLEAVRSALASRGLRTLLPGVELLALDGFYDFNPLQREVLREAVRSAPKAVALIEAELDSTQPSRRRSRLFDLPEKTLEFYRTCRPDFAESHYADGGEGRAAAMLEIAGRLFGSAPPEEERLTARGAVKLLAPRDAYAEVVEAARRIKRLAVDGECDISRAAVVIPQLEAYSASVREVFGSYGIPYTMSAAEPLGASPVCAAVMDMIEAAESGLKRTAVFRFLSSPFVRLESYGGVATPHPHELDMLAREAGIAGGSGPGVWQEAFNAYAASLEYAARQEDERGGQAREKIGAIRRCRDYAEAVFAALRRLDSATEAPPERFHEALSDTMEKFGMRRLVCEGAEGLPDADVRRNIIALGEFERVLREFCAGLELARPAGAVRVGKYGDYFSALRAEIAGASCPPSRGEPRGVRVMGMLETRGLAFDYVFLAGMTDSAFPKKRETDFFLTAEEREAAGIASISSDVTEDRYLFHRLFRNTLKELAITCPAMEGDREVVPSVFVDELVRHVADAGSGPLLSNNADCFHCERDALAAAGDGNAAVDVAAVVPREKLLHALRSAEIEEARRTGAGMPEYRAAIAGARHLEIVRKVFAPPHNRIQVTRLEEYARCPLGFFFRLVLGIQPMEEVEEEITALDRGTLVHGIVEKFYRGRFDAGAGRVRRLSRDDEDIERAGRAMLEIATAELTRFDFKGVFWDSFRDSLLVGLSGYEPATGTTRPGALKLFIQTEAADLDRPAPRFFESEFREDRTGESGGLKLNGDALRTMLPDGTPVFVRGKIDRIDILEDGAKLFFVVDYKTGQPRTSGDLRKGITEGGDLQLPVYVAMAASALGADYEPAGAALYYISSEPKKNGKASYFAREKFVDRTSSGANAINTLSKKGIYSEEEFMSLIAVEARIQALVKAVWEGRFDAAGQGGAQCDYCELNGVCRAEMAERSGNAE